MVLTTNQDSNKQYSSKFIRQGYELIEYLDRINKLRTKESSLQMRKEKEPSMKNLPFERVKKVANDLLNEGRGSNKTVIKYLADTETILLAVQSAFNRLMN